MTRVKDSGSFVAELLSALADTELFERVDLSTEGPIVGGRAYVRDDLFVRFLHQNRRPEPATQEEEENG
jgi:hypothetical protein